MKSINKYNIIDTKEKLAWLDSILMEDNKPKHKFMAFDTETNGIEYKKSSVVGLSFAVNKNEGFYLPLLKWVPDLESGKTRSVKKVKYFSYMKGHLECVWTGQKYDEFVTPAQYSVVKNCPVIPKLLRRWTKDAKLILHNAPFDVNMILECMGVDLKEQVYCDTGLLSHVLNENEPTGLKKVIERYKDFFGINPHVLAAQEKREMLGSIIKNGLSDAGKVWRADLEPQAKYGCSDAFYTFGLFEAQIKELASKFGQKGLTWFFVDEVMPVCREVVIEMKRRGVYIDVDYFTKIHKQTQTKMLQLEDEIINLLESKKLLDGFEMGKSVEEQVSDKALVLKLIELENRSAPVVVNKKGEETVSLAKAHVKKKYESDPHWIWGYLLGEDEIKYSPAKIDKIKQQMVYDKVNAERILNLEPPKRYRFNIQSDYHLRWLFCTKLKMDPRSFPQTDSATADNPIPSMSAEAIQEHILPKYPWAQKLLSYKKLLKQESTYIRPALVMNIDGWLYVDMKQNGTTSGRFSCSGGYNLQTLPRVDDEYEILGACEKCDSKNIKIHQEIETMADMECLDCGHKKTDIARPSAIKKGFIAPPGYKIINADYSSLEPRCFAEMSSEQNLKDVYLKNLDLYSQVYCTIFDDKNEYSADPKAPNYLGKVAKAKRKFIKPIVLGIPYGMEAPQIAMTIGAYKQVFNKKTNEMEQVLDFEEGHRIYDAYLGKLTNLKKYMEDQELKALTLGYVETVICRRRHLPNAKAINKVFDRHGLTVEPLLKAGKARLKIPSVNIVDRNSGVASYLSQEMLFEICKELNITEEKISSSDNWAYIKALLKNDLNNAKNNPIQGLAASITNKGMLETNRMFKKKLKDAWVCLQVHDEVTSYALIDEAQDAAAIQKLAMEENDFTKLVSIPMVAEPVVCDNLKDAK